MTRYNNPSPSLALVTCDALPDLHPDEQLLLDRFARAGWTARPVVWSDPSVDWSQFSRVVLRSTWDYFERIDAFRAWLDGLERVGARLCNPLPLVRWNLDKQYLLELGRAGVPILPTEHVAAGTRYDLAGGVRARGWSDVILKPTISGGAFRTHRFPAGAAAALQPELDRILAAGGALLQPFAPEILDEGEWSLVFFAGRFSHAVLKRAAAGEFRVQFQYGGTFQAVPPPPSLLRDAERVLGALPHAPAYARIDGLRRDDTLVLMEVEVIEPLLFLPADPAAPDRFVRACLDAYPA